MDGARARVSIQQCQGSDEEYRRMELGLGCLSSDGEESQDTALDEEHDVGTGLERPVGPELNLDA